MIEHVLQVSSSAQLLFTPEYGFKDSAKKINEEHRTRSGKLFQYKWSEYSIFKGPVFYVNSEFKSIVNSWWSTNTSLSYYQIESGTSTDVTTVRLINKSQPIDDYIKPYANLFKGDLELEETNG